MKRQYCEEHKTDKMVESGKPVCQINECLTIAIYGDEGQKASRCLVHKEKEMVDLFHKTCIFQGCKSRPSYGNGNTVLYCTKHKTDGMVDNLHTKCSEDGCSKIPCFNFEGQKQRLYCSQHAKEGMINITARECIVAGCQKPPCYNYDGQTQ
jgi:hypothetical protein